MGKFIVHDTNRPPEEIAREREQRFLNLPPMEKWNELIALINLSIKLNGGKPLKEPQGKGLVIRRKNALNDI